MYYQTTHVWLAGSLLDLRTLGINLGSFSILPHACQSYQQFPVIWLQRKILCHYAVHCAVWKGDRCLNQREFCLMLISLSSLLCGEQKSDWSASFRSRMELLSVKVIQDRMKRLITTFSTKKPTGQSGNVCSLKFILSFSLIWLSLWGIHMRRH